MTERKVSVKGLEVNYREFGDKGKTPFLILHGWRSNSERWQKVGNLLSENNFMVIIPDMPGFGKSEEPKESWDINGYVEWLKEFLEKNPELKNGFYLVGHSFGGSVAAKFCLKYNQNVKKLFLVSASCIRVLTLWKKFPYTISGIFKIFYFFPFYESFRKFIYKVFFRKSDYPYVSGIMKEIYLKVIEEDLSYKLPFLKVPTVIIWGDKDDLTPLSNAYIINKEVENSVLHIVSGEAHNLHTSCPEILAKKLLDNI